MKRIVVVRIIALVVLSVLLFRCGGEDKTTDPIITPDPDSPAACDVAVDIHQHLAANADFMTAAENLISLMDSVGIDKVLLMPPPQSATASTGAHYDYTALKEVVESFPAQLGLVGGGNILNEQMHASAVSGAPPSEAELDSFEADARAIAADGVAAFGEMAVLHLSYISSHPFIEIPADHPMMLRLADVAAEVGIPVDIHLELVVEPVLTASLHRIYTNSGNNPDTLYPNLGAFKSLLDHNPEARIVWSHPGWDNIGHLSAARLRTMLTEHANLYLALKMLDVQGAVQIKDNIPLDGRGHIRSDWESLINDFPDRFILGADEFTGDALSGETAGSPSTVGTWRILEVLSDEVARKISCENPAAIYRLNEP